MATTVPCVLRALGNKNPMGFNRADVLAAFINAGYNPEKAFRRYKQCLASHQIVNCPDEGVGGEYITLYSPSHWKLYYDALKDVTVIAVKIERDGSVTEL